MITEFGSEIESVYVDRQRDRFVVSLVFGMPDGEGRSSPDEALGVALKDLYLCPYGADHIWCVFDAKTGERTLHQASDVLPQGFSRALAVLMQHEMDEADVDRNASGVDEAGTHRSKKEPDKPAETASPPPPPGQMLLHAEMDAVSNGVPAYRDREDALDPTGEAEVLSLMRAVPWGDVQGSMATLDGALRLALAATSNDLLRWENEAHEVGLDDEFSVPPDRVASLSEEWRLAYVARLLQSAAMMYGIQDRGGASAPAPSGRPAEPGSFMRSLDAIVGRSLARGRSRA